MHLRRLATAFVAALAATSVLVSIQAPGAGAANEPIQPGVEISTSVGGCTLNFIYDGTGAQAGKVFGGTAAHCVSELGQDVQLGSTGETFGDVALIGDENSTVAEGAGAGTPLRVVCLSPQPWEARKPGYGTHRIEYRAIDAAGNIGPAKAFMVTVRPR